MTFLIRSGVAIALASFYFFCGCSAVQVQETKAILATCGIPAAEAEAASLFQTVLAIAEHQPVNAQAQLTALENNFKTGVLCALQQIADSQAGTTPVVRLAGAPPNMLFTLPSAKASTFAKSYLASH